MESWVKEQVLRDVRLCGAPWTAWVFNHVHPVKVGAKACEANYEAGDGSAQLTAWGVGPPGLGGSV